jgi:phosphatidylglycerol lysyltransferase
MNGYGADITRRIHDAPKNVTEKINYDAFMVFKDEGVEWGTLGLAPLADEHTEAGNDEDSSKLLKFVYEHFNRFYGFKSLFLAKEKYHPTIWVPGYFVYSSKNITPEIAYAIVKIQSPSGIKDYFQGSKIKKQRS